jgi:hypothetical protein
VSTTIDEQALRELLSLMTQLQIRATGVRNVLECREDSQDLVIAMAGMQGAYAAIQVQLERVLDAAVIPSTI